MEEREIVRNEQFLLFPQCFLDLYCRHVKPRLVSERVKFGIVRLNHCESGYREYMYNAAKMMQVMFDRVCVPQGKITSCIRDR